MQNVSVSRRYARALLESSGAKSDVILSQLEDLVAFLDSNAEVASVLVNPAMPRTTRLKVIEALTKSATFEPVVVNLLKLMNDRNRLEALPMLVRNFRDLVNARLGRVRGSVTSATKLGQGQLDAIRGSLEAMTKKAVLLEAKEDKGLLGGVVAQVGSRTFDGSLRTQLRLLGQQLNRGA